MKCILTLALFLLLSVASFSQTTVKKPASSKFNNESNYKKLLGKPKYKINSKQSISILLDDYFVYKTIGLGYQRKFGALMADVQVSKGIQKMGALGNESFPSMFKGLLSFNSYPKVDTAIQNFGLQIGLYRMSKYASMTGFMYGVTTTYDNYTINYRVYDPSVGTHDITKNSINKLGMYLTIGMRVIIIKNVGICLTSGAGYKNALAGNTNNLNDAYNNAKNGKLGLFGNIRLYVSL
jgi:energy-coupling factor transporter transmembrane protein EcfT